MHQTEGDNFNASDPDITGRAFQQETMSVPGSVMFAEFANAVQQEIINVGLAAGVAASVDAATDRTAGWGQMALAIFNSQAIDTSAITDGAITLAKLNSTVLTNYNVKTKASVIAIGDIADLTMDVEPVAAAYRISLTAAVFIADNDSQAILIVKYGGGEIARLYMNRQSTTIQVRETDLSLGLSQIYDADGSLGSVFKVECTTLDTGCSFSDVNFTLERLPTHTINGSW